MAAVAFLGCICTGHGPWIPRPNDEASTDVFVEGKGAHRVGDHWAVHCNPYSACHDSRLAVGSATVFINGKPVGRIGDSIACGSVIAQGCSTIFSG